MAGDPLIITAADGSWRLRDVPGLIKAHLSLYIALTAVTGHALAQNRLTIESLGLGGWVFLLSCGAGVLNNVQDRDLDRHCLRTQSRVLARGAMMPGHALTLGACLILAAGLGLWLSCPNGMPLVLGAWAIVCYNGIYTPMKQRGRWFLAMVPGTLSGMIPPAMGWAAVDTGAGPSGLYILMAGIGVWQLPHFLLVFLRENPLDPTPAGIWSAGECQAQVVAWSALFSISMMLFALTGWMASLVLTVLLFCLALALPLVLSLLFWTAGRRSLDLGFWALNLAMLAYMILILLDQI